MRFTGSAVSDPNSVYPADDYFLTCTDVQSLDKNGEPLKSKKGNDMWVLEFTVAEGPHKNRKQWEYLVWLPAGSPGHGMTLKALKAFGIDPEGDNDILPEHLLNVTVKAKVKVDESAGYEPKNTIDKWYMPGGEGQKPVTAVDQNGTAQEADSFDPNALENNVPAPTPITKQIAKPAVAKKPLWGKK